MAVGWDQDERCRIFEFVVEASRSNDRPIEEAIEFFNEFIQRPRRHSSFLEAWIEFVEEISEVDDEAQESESTDSITTQITLEEPSPLEETMNQFLIISQSLWTNVESLETSNKSLEAQEGESAESVMTQIELNSISNKSEGSEANKVIEETIETPENEEEAHHEEEEE
jgi:hypothetical protein